MKFLTKNLNKIDLFGKLFMFEEKEHQRFSTFGGIILTFIIVTTCIIIGFLFGNEIYERKDPTVIFSTEKAEQSRVNITDFPIFYAFTTKTSQNQPLAIKYLDAGLSMYEYDKNLKVTKTSYSGYKRCDKNMFTDKYRDYAGNILISIGGFYDLYCLVYDESLYFKNTYTSPESTFINLALTLKSGNFTVEEMDERDEVMSGLFFTMVYMDSFIDSSSYNSPINYYQTTNMQQLSYNLLQRHIFNLEIVNFITHQGWLLEDSKENDVFMVKSIQKETSNSPRSLLWVTICSPNIRTKIIRSYMKLQDLLAKIGGFFNALYMLSLLVSKNYVDFCFYNYIFNHFSKKKVGEVEYVNKTLDDVAYRKKTIDNVMVKMVSLRKSQTISPRKTDNDYIKDNLNSKQLNKKKDILQSKKLDYTQSKVIDKVKDSNIIRKQELNEEVPIKIINKLKRDKDKNILPEIVPETKSKERKIANPNQSSNSYFNSFANLNANTNTITNNNNPTINATNNALINESNNNSKYKINNFIGSLEENNIERFQNKLPNDNVIKDNIKSIDSINKYNNSFDLSVNKDLDVERYTKTMSYFRYIWSDIICCSNVFSLQRKAISNIISFDNIMEISYKNYIKTSFEKDSSNYYNNEYQ